MPTMAAPCDASNGSRDALEPPRLPHHDAPGRRSRSACLTVFARILPPRYGASASHRVRHVPLRLEDSSLDVPRAFF
jgi:hypothetical protein